MPSPSSVAFLAVAVLITGCRSWDTDEYFLGMDDVVLLRREDPGGRTISYRLEPGVHASLRVVTEYDSERPSLGLQLAELDKEGAERRGVRPYSGLLVRGVVAKSGAAEAGVLAGDVLLTLNGKETVYLVQAKAIEEHLQANQAVAVKVLRGQEQMDLTLTAGVKKERVRDEESVALEEPKPLPRAYAGVSLLGIPAAQCEKIFGSARQAVVVSQVEVGSPAWLAGIRAGDLIDTVDGAPVPDVHSLTTMLGERGEAGQPMRLGVRRGPGPSHEGVVALSNYRGESGAWIPLIFYLDGGTYSDYWSIGPFGLVMSNRNRYIPDATTRRVKTRNVFSALLGLFRVETSPDETQVRLLWLIRFDT